MPGRDGTGPMGAGSMTGRGLGACTGINATGSSVGLGLGLGRRMGCARGFGRGIGRRMNTAAYSAGSQKELLEQQRTALQQRIDAIDQQLKD